MAKFAGFVAYNISDEEKVEAKLDAVVIRDTAGRPDPELSLLVVGVETRSLELDDADSSAIADRSRSSASWSADCVPSSVASL